MISAHTPRTFKMLIKHIRSHMTLCLLGLLFLVLLLLSRHGSFVYQGHTKFLPDSGLAFLPPRICFFQIFFMVSSIQFCFEFKYHFLDELASATLFDISPTSSSVTLFISYFFFISFTILWNGLVYVLAHLLSVSSTSR